MKPDFWAQQTVEKPLFPDLIWNRPENRQFAGKLLIVGGNLHGFTVPATAYNEALQAGVGVARVILPNALQKTVGKLVPEAEFTPSTPSGSFAREALGEILPTAHWADGVLLAGDFGRNSETAILLESFIKKYPGQLTITKDAVDYFAKSPQTLLNRPETTLVLSLAQLQQIATNSQFDTAITYQMDMIKLVEALHNFTNKFSTNIITRHLDNTFAAVNGQVSSTKLHTEEKIWRAKTAAHASVWWLQNPQKPFESLTTSIVA
jgi:ADP-dependent NAD(P)H-hydrate dehydratase / NAD(P)H-hydrate epimerase